MSSNNNKEDQQKKVPEVPQPEQQQGFFSKISNIFTQKPQQQKQQQQQQHGQQQYQQFQFQQQQNYQQQQQQFDIQNMDIQYQQQFQKQEQISLPQVSRKRAAIQQNLSSKMVQQKYQFTNLNENEQQIYNSNVPQNVQQQQKQVDFNDFINVKQVDDDQTTAAELDENFNYKNVFLGKEGMFKDYKMIVGQFYHAGEDFKRGFLQTAGNELNRIGFKFDIVYNENEFSKKCMDYDIAYIISNTSFSGNESQFLEKIGQFMKAGKSLYIWADNTPYTAHSNIILKKYFDGMYLEGSYFGGNIIQAGEKAQKSSFDFDHSMAYGLNNLHEGITICHPVKQHKDFEIFGYNSNNEPLILFAEENENHGRIVIDTGFTKLYPQFWRNAGTHQYISNATVWLTGIVV